MKTLIKYMSAAAALGLLASTPHAVYAQAAVETSTITTTTSSGTVTEFGPGAIAIKGEAMGSPVRYTSTQTTTYVDESGNPVAIETVKSGTPVIVYYEKSPNGFVAQKVIVRKTVKTTVHD